MAVPIPGRRSAPVLVVCARDAQRRAAVVAQLEERYSATYDVVAAGTATETADVLRTTAADGGQVAILLADDPGALDDGRTVFRVASELFPDVRRGLLVEWGAWGDRATADQILVLMAQGQIDYYVIRPWHSPDEYFHRTVTEFLVEWDRAIGLRPREVSVVGDPSGARSHEVRGLLARSGIPHRFLPSDVPRGARAARRVRPRGRRVHRGPPPRRACPRRAEQRRAGVGLRAGGGRPRRRGVRPRRRRCRPGRAGSRRVRLLGGPADARRRAGVDRWPGGSSSLIRNYLGFARGISGAELAQRAYQQAWVFGCSFAHSRAAVSLEADDDGLVLGIEPDRTVRARSAVLATGVAYRQLGVPELAPYESAGVYHGASAFDAQGLRGRTAHVVGGGNSAGQAALHLARYAGRVTLLVRGQTLAESMSRYLIDTLTAAGVEVRLRAAVVGGGGQGHLEHVVVRDLATGESTTEPTDAVFVLIGAMPRTQWLPPAILRDRWGYVLTGEDVVAEGGRRAWPHEEAPGLLETSLRGVFAVGDARRGSVKRVASAVGEGSVVVSSVHAHLRRLDARDASGR